MSITKKQSELRDKFMALMSQRSKLLLDIEQLYSEAKELKDDKLQDWILEYIFKNSSGYAPFFVPAADK